MGREIQTIELQPDAYLIIVHRTQPNPPQAPKSMRPFQIVMLTACGILVLYVCLYQGTTPPDQEKQIWIPAGDQVVARTISSQFSRRRTFDPREIELKSDRPFSAVLLDMNRHEPTQLAQARQQASDAILRPNPSEVKAHWTKQSYQVQSLRWRLPTSTFSRQNYLLLVGRNAGDLQSIKLRIGFGGKSDVDHPVVH